MGDRRTLETQWGRAQDFRKNIFVFPLFFYFSIYLTCVGLVKLQRWYWIIYLNYVRLTRKNSGPHSTIHLFILQALHISNRLKEDGLNTLNTQHNDCQVILPRLTKLITISASFRKAVSWYVARGRLCVVEWYLSNFTSTGFFSSPEMVLYKSSIKSGAELYFPWARFGFGLCGSPRMDSISFCISLFSCVRSRRWMKPRCTSLFPPSE